jgi:hypothetical protein
MLLWLGVVQSRPIASDGKASSPLEDITNTQKSRAVVADGRLCRETDLDRLLAEVEVSIQQAENRE